MNLLLRLSHASTAFDDSGNLMHDTSLFFVFANYSRLWRETANPRPGFLGNPIVKANLKQLLRCLCFPIKCLYNIIARRTSELETESNPRLPG